MREVCSVEAGVVEEVGELERWAPEAEVSPMALVEAAMVQVVAAGEARAVPARAAEPAEERPAHRSVLLVGDAAS